MSQWDAFKGIDTKYYDPALFTETANLVFHPWELPTKPLDEVMEAYHKKGSRVKLDLASLEALAARINELSAIVQQNALVGGDQARKDADNAQLEHAGRPPIRGAEEEVYPESEEH